MLAPSATGIVVIHDALADAGFPLRHPHADRHDHATGLVAGNHGLGTALEAGACIAGLERSAVDVQIAAAHPRGLDLEHDVARAGRGVGKVTQLELAVTDKHHALHAILLGYLLDGCRRGTSELSLKSPTESTADLRRAPESNPRPILTTLG